jgi:hypothetical protein
MPWREVVPPIRPRDAVSGRHLAVTQAPSGTAGSNPVPRTPGPEHEWQCNSPARSEVTVRARLGPPHRKCRTTPVARAGVAETVDAPGSDPGGLGPMRVRLSPPALLRLCGNGKPSGFLPRGSEFESPEAYELLPRAAHSGVVQSAAHLALNQEMGDRALPSELILIGPRNNHGLWRSRKRAAFGAPRTPVRVRPTRPLARDCEQ